MKKSLIFFILVFAFSISLVYAESCYIRLEINETFKNNVTSFSLLTQENLYGNYDGLVYLYDLGVGSPYILNVYSSQVEKYGLESSRFMFYDNFNDTENPGGIIESESGIISVVIYYNETISRITIDYNGTETDLNVDLNNLKCERTCKIKGEIGSYEKNENCCSVYRKAAINTTNFACIVCGDSLCEENEDRYSCYEDCAKKSGVIRETVKVFVGSWIVYAMLAIVLIVAALLIIYILRKIKK